MRSGDAATAFRQGLLSNLTNLKMPVFFVSLLPQFGGSFLALTAHGLAFAALTLGSLTLVSRGAGMLIVPRVRGSSTWSPAWCSSRSGFAWPPSAGRVSRVLEIVAAGMRFVARWEEELAPSTVAAFKASLPMDERIIHCRWSGESNWIPWGTRDFGIGPENATSYPHPGELALYPGGQSETELLFPYGYCNFASKAGQLWANHFATVVDGAEQLPQLGKLTLWEGAQPITFRAL